MEKKFISKHGFILPNSNQEQSENGVLFSVVHHFLRLLLDRSKVHYMDQENLSLLIESLWKTNGGYRTLPNDDNDRFSLDNSIAVAAYSRLMLKIGTGTTTDEVNLQKVPVLPYYYRFYDVVPFLIVMKNPWMLWFVSPVVWLTTILPCAIYPPSDSSGRQLAFVKCMALGSPILFYLCELALATRGLDFEKVFATYYPEADHPINVLSRQLSAKE